MVSDKGRHWIKIAHDADETLEVAISRARFRFVIYKNGERIAEVLEPRSWKPWEVQDFVSNQWFLVVTHEEVAEIILAISGGDVPPDGVPFKERFPEQRWRALQRLWEKEWREVYA